MKADRVSAPRVGGGTPGCHCGRTADDASSHSRHCEAWAPSVSTHEGWDAQRLLKGSLLKPSLWMTNKDGLKGSGDDSGDDFFQPSTAAFLLDASLVCEGHC